MICYYITNILYMQIFHNLKKYQTLLVLSILDMCQALFKVLCILSNITTTKLNEC